MKNGILMMAATASFVLSGSVFPQDKPPDCGKGDSPEMIEGQVTRVDTSQGKLTLRAQDGSLHEFQASPETLGAYKVGDSIKAKLRKDPRCN